MNTKIKLTIAAMVCTLVVFYTAYLGLATTWQYYLLVDECQSESGRFHGHRVRVSGKVRTGTLAISHDRRSASFVLGGEIHEIPVTCAGPLPDNLAEDIDVVVEGVLRDDGRLQGHRVITRCASKYAPKSNSKSTAPGGGGVSRVFAKDQG